MAERAARVRTSDVVIGTGSAAVEAYVVEPAAGPARAGILFLHWLGDHRSDRTQFLSEARELARSGVRCVLPAGQKGRMGRVGTHMAVVFAGWGPSGRRFKSTPASPPPLA